MRNTAALLALAALLLQPSALARIPDQVYVMPGSGNVPGWGQVDLSKTAATKSQLLQSRGGTGIDTSASTGVPVINGGTWTVPSLLPVTKGGTGVGTFTTNAVPIGNGTSALTDTGAGNAYDELQVPSGGGAPAFTPKTSPTDRTNYSVVTSVATNALTIALKNKAGSNASASSPIRIAFTAATSSGAASYAVGEVTGALSLTVTSGATLGCVSGLACRVYLYALLNGSTVELAVIQAIGVIDEATAATTTIMDTNSDAARVPYSTTARNSVFMRYLATITLTEATAGTYVTLPSAIGYHDPKWVGYSVADANTCAAGHGSDGGNLIPYYTNATSSGTAISFTNSTTAGASFTVNEPGYYCMSMTHRVGVNTEDQWGISINASVTTALTTLSSANMLCVTGTYAVSGASVAASCSWCGTVGNGDVIRPHTNSGSATTSNTCHFHMEKVVSQ